MQNYSLLRQIISFTCIALFVGLVLFITLYPDSTFDLAVSSFIQSHSRETLTALMHFVTSFGNLLGGTLVFAGALIVFLLTGYRREAAFIVLTVPANFINVLLKEAFHRTRPTSDAVEVLHELTSHSFPSGHVVHYMVFFGFILTAMFYVTRFPKWIRISIGTFCGFLILTVGFSRIYLGAHWATDVIGGYLVGTVLLLILVSAYLKGQKLP